MKRFLRTHAVLSAALIAGAALAIAISAGEAPKQVRIIYTNDTLGYLESCG